MGKDGRNFNQKGIRLANVWWNRVTSTYCNRKSGDIIKYYIVQSDEHGCEDNINRENKTLTEALRQLNLPFKMLSVSLQL